ncbi:fumarate hydratase [Paenibacillus xerothermodurans]|uniref:fumarate hydratase n=1 Tax=Paenibacillus xerothermodurans TaxID=1977292 RepID=UPI001A9F89A3|nr:fumarate hydratase [Paenibacillus xerothermodurans]
MKNAQLAAEEDRPYCHDAGLTVVYADVGQDVHIQGGDFTSAIHESIRKGYKEGYLRNSIVSDPLLRKNTNDNTPGVIHTRIVPGEQMKLTVLPKGGGSENMSAMKFLLPGEGVAGVKKFVLDTIIAAGGRACPPLVVGVGIGPQGLGGTNTAIWVAVETYGCHITALPVAVNIQCHAARKTCKVI